MSAIWTRQLAAGSNKLVFCLAACLAVGITGSLFTGVVQGQSTFGEFVGTVHDPSGSGVASAVVKVINTGTSATRSTVTEASGEFTLVNIEPGEYLISVESPGFQVAKVSGLTLQARQTIRQDVGLSLATQSQVVNVTEAAAAPLNTEVSNIAETKIGRELVDLPVAIASRAGGSTSPITTLTTQPGVETDASGNISVAGSKPSMLSASLDGISTVSPKGSAPLAELFPSFDTIAEIRVSEVNNTAEFGGISDITTISKSGNNSYHGGMYENAVNRYLNARNEFQTVKPSLVENDFGAFLGGKIKIPKLYDGQDKTFFFMSYEGLRLPKGSTLITSVPTSAMRAGDLSVYLPKTVVKDPLGGSFNNNQIPLTRITPLSLRVLDYLFPLPNTGPTTGIPTNNYQQNYSTPLSTNQGDMRLDRNLTSRQTVFARVSYKRRESENAPSGTGVFGYGNTIANDYSVSGTYNFVLTPHLINEARAGLTGSNSGTGYGYTSAGVAAALGLTLAGPPPVGAASPSFTITGFSGTSGGSTSLSKTNTRQVLDNLTYIKGKHTLKFGMDYRFLNGLYTNVFAGNRMGSYTFNNSATSSLIGSPFGAFLLGIPDRSGMATVTNPNTDSYAQHYAAYVQDDFKVTQRFTLNVGLRYEYHPMFTDRLHNVANWLPDYTQVVNGVTIRGAAVVPDAFINQVNPDFARTIGPAPVLTATQAGIPQSLRYSQKTDFAPRIGFAWRATKDSKTVIRAGYGRYIETELGALINAGWAVGASDVGTFTNTIVGGKPTYSFPQAWPTILAQPGTLNFDLGADIHYKDPYVQQWNFTVERDLGFQAALRLSYDGSKGSDLGITENSNQIPANTIGYATAVKTLAPFSTLAQNTYLTNGARSNYNAFTVTVNKRMSKGLQFQTSYNFAKNLSNGGGSAPTAFAGEGGGTVSDPYNLGLDYGNVAFTRRNRFQTTFLYTLPYRTKNKFVNQAISGWEIAGVMLFQDGPFLTVTDTGIDPGGTNAANFGGSQRVDVISGVSPVPTSQTITQWTNPAAFTIPANNIGRIGNEPVGYVRGPGTSAVSLSLFRSFSFKERVRLRLGISAANAMNHPNYGTPSLNLSTLNTFGLINSLQSSEGAGPRQVQLTGRITF